MPEPSTMEQIKSPEQSEQELLTEREQPPREEFPEAGLRDEAPGQQAPEALELLEEEDSLPPVDASEEAEAPALNEAPSRPKRAMSSAPSRKVPPRWLLIVCAVAAVLLVVTLVFSLAAASKPEPAPVFDVYSYDSQGRVTTHIKQRADGSISFRRESAYDEAGNLISLRIYAGGTQLTFSQEWSYQDGLLAEKLILSPEGSVERRTLYEYTDGVLLAKSSYDAYGNLLQYIRYTANGNALYWEVYEYSSSRQLLRFTRYNADRKADYWREYTYDEKGLELSRSRYGSRGQRTEWSEYEYDELDRLLCQKQYDSTGELNTQTDFSYNEDGSFTVWTYFYDYDGSVSREMSVYDKNGNRTHYAAYPAGGYLSHGSDSRYDENGNIIEHSEFGLYGVTYKWYTYEYDDQGRELRRYTKSLYERSSWYENRYDEEGNCVERIYYDAEGNVTDRVENPAPEVSFRMIYRPDW